MSKKEDDIREDNCSSYLYDRAAVRSGNWSTESSTLCFPAVRDFCWHPPPHKKGNTLKVTVFPRSGSQTNESVVEDKVFAQLDIRRETLGPIGQVRYPLSYHFTPSRHEVSLPPLICCRVAGNAAYIIGTLAEFDAGRKRVISLTESRHSER